MRTEEGKKNAALVRERYDKENTKHYHLKLNLNTDADIIKQLVKQDSMQGYIKRLIREDIAKNS